MAVGGLGDALLLTPFIRHFHQSRSYSRIVCVCSPQAVQLFDQNPLIDQIVCEGAGPCLWALSSPNRDIFSPFHTARMEINQTGDLQIVVERRLKPAMGHGHVLEQIARSTGITPKSWKLDLFTSSADRAAADQILAEAGAGTRVLIGFESKLPVKNLPVQLRRAVRRLLRQAGLVLLEAHTRKLRMGRRTIKLPGPRIMAEVARRCQAIITVDSFLAHLSQTVATPAVVLFGSSHPDVYGYPTNCNLRPSACPPCAGTARRKTCPAPVCMSAFSAGQIAASALKIIRRGGA